MDYRVKYEQWLNSEVIDKADKEELLSIKDNEKEIDERFYTDLAFGTGGMRGVRGIGTNRMNKYMIRKATQGLVNYMLKVDADRARKEGVAIAYDCRIGSTEYALNTALVLAANGIKAYLFESLRSTPELSFAVRETGSLAGVVVTASHNPVEYNGYKVYWDDGAQIVEPHADGVVDEVNAIKDLSEIKIISEEEARSKGLIIDIGAEIDDKYIETIKKEAIQTDIQGKGDFKIVYSPLHGTGKRPVERVLKEMGFNAVYTVASQAEPDGTFPTVGYANPEEPAVFKLGIELAEEVGATICMANDPDADRIGIAVKDGDKWIYPNGNQVGLLLMNYILENKKDIPANGAVISTVVSTPMLETVAKAHGVKVYRTLTGFKYIGEKIREFETGALDGTYLFGFEESYGYLIGTHARDKDAIVSSLVVAELAAYYASKGTNVANELRAMYDKYGWYKEGIISVTMGGKEGVSQIQGIMEKLRANPPKEINGVKAVTLKDFELQAETDIATGAKTEIKLPKSNVIQVILEDGTYITARPSGTEPKIKYYFGVNAKTESLVEEKMESMKKAFTEIVK